MRCCSPRTGARGDGHDRTHVDAELAEALGRPWDWMIGGVVRADLDERGNKLFVGRLPAGSLRPQAITRIGRAAALLDRARLRRGPSPCELLRHIHAGTTPPSPATASTSCSYSPAFSRRPGRRAPRPLPSSRPTLRGGTLHKRASPCMRGSTPPVGRARRRRQTVIRTAYTLSGTIFGGRIWFSDISPRLQRAGFVEPGG